MEGTVASIVHEQRGERVRLTNGMDLLVPNSITSNERGRRSGAATLEAGDVVRMNVYSREGDGRDAVVRSMEIMERNGVYQRDRRMSGSVLSTNRRNRSLVMKLDNGRIVDVDLSTLSDENRSARRYRNGDRVSVTGRMNRGTIIADDIRGSNERGR